MNILLWVWHEFKKTKEEEPFLIYLQWFCSWIFLIVAAGLAGTVLAKVLLAAWSILGICLVAPPLSRMFIQIGLDLREKYHKFLLEDLPDYKNKNKEK